MARSPVLALLAAFLARPLAVPLYHGCLDNVSQALPYCDFRLSDEERVADILSRLTTDEKISLLSGTDLPRYCQGFTRPIERIGLPGFKWLTEVNSNVGVKCLNGRCVTNFIGPLGSGASFNRSSWWAKGDVISSELRAYNNAAFDKIGVTGFGPNINLLKDPRWGRNSELPGEDPFLSGSYAVSFLKGMQQKDGRLKMLAYVKHYTAYNVEKNRHTFSNNVSQFTFWDSYLPHYEMAFTEGNASGAMCSYFAPNGVSSCGNSWLLNEVIRNFWKRPDAVVMSDCGAVKNMAQNGYAHDDLDASAKALNAGLDLYGGWGDNLWGPPPYGRGDLLKAIDEKRSSVKDLDAAVERTLLQKMKAGVFDPLEGQSFTKIAADEIGSAKHEEVSYEAALQGMVLLKNEGVLPLKERMNVAVVGPFADEGVGLFSSYATPHGPFDTLRRAIGRVNRGETTFAKGVDVDSDNASGIAAALELAEGAEVVVLALGITKQQEHEEMDRKDTLLPGLQPAFAQRVFALGKPVVLTLCNGGVLMIDELVPKSKAIVETFSPAKQGPRALAELLFGRENRWGKLPVTVYDDHKMLPITDMSFDKAPGRSYRYYQGKPTFPFGHGLSYTTFSFSCELKEGAAFELRCRVKNTGEREGDEVLLLYHSVSQEIRRRVQHPVPFKRLVGFERVRLARGEEQEVVLKVLREKVAITDEEGDYVVYTGKHIFLASRGHGEEQALEFEVKESWKRRNSHPSQEEELQLLV